MSGAEMGAGQEEDLPWLETVEEDYEEGPSLWRILLLVLLGLAVLGAAIFGYYWYQQQRGIAGSGELIEAQEGDYKVRPEEPGGMQAEGEGDAAFAASEGAITNATIDTSATPEAPVASKPVVTPKPAEPKGTTRVIAKVPDASRATPSQPKPAASAGSEKAASGGAVVQLGSFPSQGAANTAWDALSKRFSYLAPLGKSVEKAEVNGNTVYRLRVGAGSNSQAKELCGKLKVAGEACYVAR